MSKMGAREVAALVPPAFKFEQNQSQLEVTNWDTSDSEADPGSPELRRSLTSGPVRKVDDSWGSGAGKR